MTKSLAPPAFSYSAPTTVWCAPDALARLASYLRRLGISRALLVTDAHLEAAGAAGRVTEAAEGRTPLTWAGVESDAPRASVEAGAEEARRARADAIVALGGGSAIDTAKAIALLARHGGDVARWDGANKVGAAGLPVVAIPTTAGTGSEVSNIAVIKDPAAGRKLIVIDRSIYPAVALLDPQLTVDLPPLLTAATGLDALTHAVEGLVSRYRNPVCDGIGLECVRLVRAWLPRVVRAPDDLEARGWMLIAASMAGQLVSLTFSGIAHAVAHSLGFGWGVHHGTGNAIALPWSIRFNAGDAPSAAAYARCADAFGVDAASDPRATAERLADAIEAFVAELGLPTRIRDVGVERHELPRLAAAAFADPSTGPNPVKVTTPHELEGALESLF